MEGNDPTLAWTRRLDAKLDRVLSVLVDHTGRLQRLEGRLTSLSARFAEIETFDREVTRGGEEPRTGLPTEAADGPSSPIPPRPEHVLTP